MIVRGVQGLGARSRRDLLRKTWVPQGKGLRDIEEEKSVVIRFVVGYRCGAAHTCPTLARQPYHPDISLMVSMCVIPEPTPCIGASDIQRKFLPHTKF